MSTTALSGSGASPQLNQAAVKKQLDALQQSVAADQKSGQLTGDALKQAQQQVKDLTTAFNNQSQNGAISQSNLQFFSKQISGGNAVLAQAAGANGNSSTTPANGATATTTGTATTTPANNASGTTTNSAGGTTNDASGATSPTPAANQNNTALSAQVQAQLQALNTLTQLNQNGGFATGVPNPTGAPQSTSASIFV